MTSGGAQTMLFVFSVALLFVGTICSQDSPRVGRWLVIAAALFAAPAIFTLWRIAILG